MIKLYVFEKIIKNYNQIKKNKNTCVLIWNSSSPEEKTRWKDGVGSIPQQGHFQELLNWLLNF